MGGAVVVVGTTGIDVPFVVVVVVDAEVGVVVVVAAPEVVVVVVVVVVVDVVEVWGATLVNTCTVVVAFSSSSCALVSGALEASLVVVALVSVGASAVVVNVVAALLDAAVVVAIVAVALVSSTVVCAGVVSFVSIAPLVSGVVLESTYEEVPLSSGTDVSSTNVSSMASPVTSSPPSSLRRDRRDDCTFDIFRHEAAAAC